tara:strand:+ start:168 stop:602 length:435 start_codon:yes stop_codon:yes gene_type:complete
MNIKTFRGTLADNQVQLIRLSTNNGKQGYKVHKIDLMAYTPHVNDQESVVQIFTVPVDTASATVEFENPTLLAAATITNETDSRYYQPSVEVIFDTMKFNQDIYITHVDTHSGGKCNYMLQLELVNLSTDEATVATLKDMRGRE